MLRQFMLDASVVFLIFISALVTVIWIKGNVGDKLGGIVVDQSKEKSDLGSMEREVSNITQHVGSTFRKGSKEAREAKEEKDENDSESKNAKKKKNDSGKKSVDTDQGNSENGGKKGGSRRKKNRQK